MEQDTSSQKPAHPPVQAGLSEQWNAENSAAFILARLQSMKEQNPNLTLLDVGAGSGTISASFAKAIPDGHVTGLDVNPSTLPKARAVAGLAGLKNIEFQEGDAKKLPFADATFDIVFCHQVLTHMSAPWDALREMHRVAKPGGFVAAREGDYETECVWPELPALLKFHKLAAAVMGFSGGTSSAGRQLLPWALKAGIERSQITPSYSTWSYHTPSDRNIWAQDLIKSLRGDSTRDKAVKLGLTTESEAEDMAKAWEEWAERDDASLAMLNGEILIRK